MANNQPAEQDHFDLLPFIAIMMCLLGTLLLVTMSMAAINVGAGAGEGWVPEQDPGAKIPVLIEWDGHSAIWHSDAGIRTIEVDLARYARTNVGWLRVDPDGGQEEVRNQKGGDLKLLLDYLETRKQTHYALLAIRPEGFFNLRRFTARFQERKIEIGSEPVEAGKPIHLILPANPGETGAKTQ